MRKDDTVRLRHMSDAAQEAVSFIQGRESVATYTVIESLRCLWFDSSRLSEKQPPRSRRSFNKPTLKSHGHYVSMRNRLIHAYFDVDVDRIWDTVKDDLPPLILQLQTLLSQ